MLGAIGQNPISSTAIAGGYIQIPGTIISVSGTAAQWTAGILSAVISSPLSGVSGSTSAATSVVQEKLIFSGSVINVSVSSMITPRISVAPVGISIATAAPSLTSNLSLSISSGPTINSAAPALLPSLKVLFSGTSLASLSASLGASFNLVIAGNSLAGSIGNLLPKISPFPIGILSQTFPGSVLPSALTSLTGSQIVAGPGNVASIQILSLIPGASTQTLAGSLFFIVEFPLSSGTTLESDTGLVLITTQSLAGTDLISDSGSMHQVNLAFPLAATTTSLSSLAGNVISIALSSQITGSDLQSSATNLGVLTEILSNLSGSSATVSSQGLQNILTGLSYGVLVSSSAASPVHVISPIGTPATFMAGQAISLDLIHLLMPGAKIIMQAGRPTVYFPPLSLKISSMEIDVLDAKVVLELVEGLVQMQQLAPHRKKE
jgi:hypothetical protein